MTAPVALFDFDGTIVRRDSTATLVKQLLRLRPWRAAMIAPMVVRMRRARTPDALQAAKCAIIGALLSGLRQERVEKAVERASEIVRRDRRSQVVDALHACGQRGDRVIVVSASPGLFLRVALRDLPVDVIATEFVYSDGRYSGALAGTICFGAAKVPAIRGRIDDGAVIEQAWSDSLQDLPMMRLAQQRFWLCPPAHPDAVRQADAGAIIVGS